MKLIIFIGTRPEAIKLYPLIVELKKEKSFNVKVCFTGQHDFLLNKVLKELNQLKRLQKIFIDLQKKILQTNK